MFVPAVSASSTKSSIKSLVSAIPSDGALHFGHGCPIRVCSNDGSVGAFIVSFLW